jgi:radical SAM protein with 4Fe4S-binding SPASM domain
LLVCKIKQFNNKIEQGKSRPLSGLSVEFTRRCNFRCEHCFLANPLEDAPEENPLSYEEWLRIFDQYVDEDGLFITVTGGEPLLRPDFKELWIAMKKRGFIISLFTNGSLIDEEMVKFLSQWTPHEVSISLYGASNSTYQAVTGREKMYDQVIHALDMLKDAGIPLEVKGVFSKINIDDFHTIKKIGETYCELFRWDVDLMGAFSYSGNTPQDIRLSPAECAEIEANEPIRNQELKNSFENWSPPDHNTQKSSPFTCGIGFFTAYIDSKGGMRPCLPLESMSYDLRSGTIKDGWYRAIPQMLMDFPHEPGPCQSCDAIALCGQCTAFALLDGCSATGMIPFKCELAFERAKKYGLLDKIKNFPYVD